MQNSWVRQCNCQTLILGIFQHGNYHMAMLQSYTWFLLRFVATKHQQVGPVSTKRQKDGNSVCVFGDLWHILCVRHAHNCRLLCPMPLNQGCIETICDFFWQGIVNIWFLCHLSYLWQPDWPIINQDFLQHAKIADRLLGHYCQQWKNRESYWLARSRAQQVGDLCCMMIDSYDKAKCMLPKFPRGRTPKQVIYESVKRIWSNFSLLFLTRILVLVVLLLWNGRVKVLPWLWLAAWFMDLACTSTWLMKDFLVGPTGQSKWWLVWCFLRVVWNLWFRSGIHWCQHRLS